MKKNLKFFALLSMALLGSSVYGQKVGTTSLQFLKVMPTARATAMGDAFATLSSGADAVFWNPAGLAKAVSMEFATTMTLWIFDTRQTTLSAALPLGDGFGFAGVQLQYADYGSIKETRVTDLGFVGTGSSSRYLAYTGRTFSPYAYVVGVSYANNLTDKFSTGITAKYVKESLFSSARVTVTNPSDGSTKRYKTYTDVLLFDFGMQYNTGFRSIGIGVSVQNFGSQVKFAEEGFPAPLAFRLGTSVNLLGNNALLVPDESNRLTFAYDIFQPNDYEQQMHVGIEYSFSDVVALRTGYKVNYDSERMTFGGGVKTHLQGFGISFDYSYAGMGEFLSNVHRISLGLVLQ